MFFTPLFFFLYVAADVVNIFFELFKTCILNQ